MTIFLKRIATSTLIALSAGPLFAASSMAGTDAVAVANAASTSNDGTVTLSGWISGPNQESQVRHIASNVPGTTKVFSRLRTGSSETFNG